MAADVAQEQPHSGQAQPIRIPCEGSNCPVHHPFLNGGMCAMCGVTVTCSDEGIAFAHERNDVLAMLERGDFS